MAGFRDALKAYKQNSAAQPNGAAVEAQPAASVAVNPPEAPAIMEEKTVPETEGKAEPAPLEVAKPKQTRAPRGSKSKSAEPTASTASGPTTEEPASEGDVDDNERARGLLSKPGVDGHAFAVETRVLVEALFVRGYGVTRL